jgi:hypothetical protein
MEHGRTSSECGALCIASYSKEEINTVSEIRGIDSYIIALAPERFGEEKENILCTVYSSGDRHEGLYTLVVIGNEYVKEYESLVAENKLSLIGTFEAMNKFPVIRICDAREAYFVPKSASREMISYAARKANCSEEILQSGNYKTWDLCEPLHSMPASFRVEFWTGLDPQPMLEAFEAAGLIGWTQDPSSRHWSLPPTTSTAVIEQQYDTFERIKETNKFRCGYDTKCDHFIYDILQKKLEEAVDEGKGGCVYPSNSGQGVAIDATNDVWVIQVLKPYEAYVIRALTDEERDHW